MTRSGVATAAQIMYDILRSGVPDNPSEAFKAQPVHPKYADELHGNCHGTDTDSWYPPAGRGRKAAIDCLKRICADCPILARCHREVERWPAKQRFVGMVAGGVWYPDKRNGGT